MHARVTRLPVDELRGIAAEEAAGALGLVPLAGEGDALSIVLCADEATARAGPGDLYAVATDDRRPDREARYARVSGHVGNAMRDVSAAPLLGLEGLAAALMLIDRGSGDGLGILLFDSEEALRRGDEFVRSAPPGTAGAATDVELYEVLFAT